ncbi:MAG: hypothetical protein Kow00121_38440 [Elainellaceae cyanobacterium]
MPGQKRIQATHGKERLPDQERIQATKRNARRFYLILLVLGLAIGAVAAAGIVAVMQRLGLDDVPSGVPTIEAPAQEPE